MLQLNYAYYIQTCSNEYARANIERIRDGKGEA